MSEQLPVFIPEGKEQEWPHILDCELSEERARLTMFVPCTTHWFTGHFDDQPVLPGVAQVYWAEHFTRILFAMPRGSYQIKNLKFLTMVLPNTELELTIEHHSAKRQWSFRYCREDTIYSSGTFILAEEAGPVAVLDGTK